MATAWFIAPYKRMPIEETGGEIVRYVSIDDMTNQIRNIDGGDWSATEILGDHALVKVRAEPSTLAEINAMPGVIRIPKHVNLDDTLGDLTPGERTAIRNKLNALGYTNYEINNALPTTGWQNVTLKQVLNFAATRRLKPRYDEATDTIILDGEEQPVRPVEDVDGAA